jgi:hypothetical protein
MQYGHVLLRSPECQYQFALALSLCCPSRRREQQQCFRPARYTKALVSFSVNKARRYEPRIARPPEPQHAAQYSRRISALPRMGTSRHADP